MVISSLIGITPIPLIYKLEGYMLGNYTLTKKALTSSPASVFEAISERKLLNIFRSTVKNTPAYAKFLKKHKVDLKSIKTVSDFNKKVPASDKKNYIKKYKFEDRCFGGRLPLHGNVDESGGTSGVATNWIHDAKEEDALFKAVKFELNYAFEADKKNLFVLSGWSCGPWATGVKFCELMERLTLVKNTGTDPNDIIRTLKMFGPKHDYLIGAYPPFLKNLIDEHADEINWKKYNIDLVIGGEGVTLQWVDYMKAKLKKGAKIVSSYGCSDVDIGVGFESPLAHFIRRQVAKKPGLRKALFGKQSAIPMIFQYNPTVHYINQIVTKDGKNEFEITLLDPAAALPKIKYNLHDEGKVFKHNELLKILRQHIPDFDVKFAKSGGKISEILRLPFITIFGRSDGTLSFDGANVFPNQIEKGIQGHKLLSKKTNRFKIEKKYDKNHNTEFHVHVELKKGHKSVAGLKKTYLEEIVSTLNRINPDFKESYANNRTIKPKINIYKNNHKLFSQDDGKVKNIYIVKR
ncbi:hypothetical protein HOA92_04510 [archaeon]|nr:hypothetical protein [archaeon]MBT6762278.1 hypothetical protein [archaeon]